MNRTRFLTGASLATAALGLRGWAPAGAEPFPQLQAAGSVNDTGGLLFYAHDMGFFDKAKLPVAVSPLGSSGTISAAIASGSLQIGSIPVSAAALARDRGLPLVMIAPAGLYLSTIPTAGLLVLKDSPIRKAADLNGKTIATRDLSNMSYFGAKQWIDKNGGDSKSIRWIEISDTSDAAALAAGRIDAASVSEPALDDALRGGTVRSLAPVFDAIAKRFLISGYFTAAAFAQEHPDAVRAFAGVMASTAAWANKNHAQTAKILEKYAQAPVPPDSPRVEYADRLAVADVQPVLDLLFTYGVLKVPARAKDFFSPLVAPA